MRCRIFRLALKNLGNRPRDLRAVLRCTLALTDLVGVFGALARGFLDLAFLGRRQVDPGPAGLGKADGDRLLGRACAVFAMSDLLDLLVYELASLRARRLAFALIL